MKKVFKGPFVFWLALILSSIIIFSLGLKHLHVSYFNLFITVIFLTSAFLLIYILKYNKNHKIDEK
mgnify:FL=1|tara:strand:- start:205 stop:402 length:198 start_codon:yes stop_codon:yes gene_type:complete